MHSWDILPQNANYEQNWCGSTTTTTTSASSLRSGIGGSGGIGGTHIKIEPSPPSPSSETPFDTIDLKSNLNNNKNNNNNNTAILLGMAGLQQQQRNNESNPTSPHSIGSDESLVNQATTNLYYNDTLHSLINGNGTGIHHRPLGFNPLTPPGYPLPNCLRPQDLNSITESMLPTTPSRRSYAKSEAAAAAAAAFNSASLTPIHTPPMDQTPPKSPKFNGSATATSDISEKDGTDLETGSISGDDTKSLYSDYNQEISKPKVNSHGKVKTHKCKHCTYVGVTKKDFWEHSRQHIKPEKQICCTKCPFVTEFKHHYEYHLRNHKGEKPFKCSECTYSCVNKSMLNSHLKSHSDVYQYRCENCNYATKYVHSLKLHLRKYEHHPAVPLDTDGVPDPMPIIDVHGTRRGPKKRGSKAKREAKKLANKMLKLKESCMNNNNNGGGNNITNTSPQKAVQVSQLHSNHGAQMVGQGQQQQQQTQLQQHHQQLQQQQQQQQQQLNQQQQQQQTQQALSNLLPPFLPNHLANMLPYFNLQMLAAQQQVFAAARCNGAGGRPGAAYENLDCDDDDDDDDDDMNITINGSNNSMRDMHNDLDINHPESPTSSVPNTSHPNSMNNSSTNHHSMSKISGSDDDRHSSFDCGDVTKLPINGTNFSSSVLRCSDIDKSSDLNTAITTSVTANAAAAAAAAAAAVVTSQTPPARMFDCKYCGISFQDIVIHQIHMGYHGFNDVFTCNMCGEKCSDRISFFLHIAKNQHS